MMKKGLFDNEIVYHLLGGYHATWVWNIFLDIYTKV